MTYFTTIYLDIEKDIAVDLYRDLDRLQYELSTPNHGSGNLIRNLAKLCGLPLSENAQGNLVIRGEIPCYINGDNEDVYIFRMGKTKMANIYPDGRVEMKAAIPAISKTLMSQTRDYRLGFAETIFKTCIPRDYKFRSDLHTHMNGNLAPDILIALGIYHQIRYPLYYVRKLDLALTAGQEEELSEQRERVARQFVDSGLRGKYLDRKINDNTFINFADLILNNLDNAHRNISRIRTSLAIMKDGQAVFTNLEKVYLYRYVFCKGQESEERIPVSSPDAIPDRDVRGFLAQMMKDGEDPAYHDNTIYQDLLLWIARSYARQGISYAEISDTTLVKKYESIRMLEQVHAVMPKIYQETGVMIRFLAAIRRIPLTIVRDQRTPEDYLAKNVNVLKAVAADPYVAGCDFVGEEINDINTLKPVFREIVKICAEDPGFVIRVHAGENDSQKDNIAHSIACVRDSLAPGQSMPRMRLGHGLYMHSLGSRKGKAVLSDLKKYQITLEFQLTSNVRLNNLNSLDNHPLRAYIAAGIPCVQGTDGAALYGTSSIDEQLALEKLLGLTPDEMAWMKQSETRIIEESRRGYSEKKERFLSMLKEAAPEKKDRDKENRDEKVREERIREEDALEALLLERMEKAEREGGAGMAPAGRRRLDANQELKDVMEELPWDRQPVILMGGSFNTKRRTTRVTGEGCAILERLMDRLDPEEYFFVIGHKLSGYERYLVDHNRKNFLIFAIVPSRISRKERDALLGAGLSIRVSTESEGMGIYKSFNYEIFERRPSLILGFDGNSAGINLIQEAKNGKGHAKIYVWEKCRTLREKARSLEGYVRFFSEL